MLSEVIGKCQHAFVGGRKILYAVMAADETVDDLLVEKRDGLVCKLDMKKAFDNVNCNLLNTC